MIKLISLTFVLYFGFSSSPDAIKWSIMMEGGFYINSKNVFATQNVQINSEVKDKNRVELHWKTVILSEWSECFLLHCFSAYLNDHFFLVSLPLDLEIEKMNYTFSIVFFFYFLRFTICLIIDDYPYRTFSIQFWKKRVIVSGG